MAPIEELGYWEGMIWHFYQPFTMPHGHTVEKIDLSSIPDLPPDCTPRDIIMALTDPGAVAVPYDDDDELGDQFKPIHLPGKGQP